MVMIDPCKTLSVACHGIIWYVRKGGVELKGCQHSLIIYSHKSRGAAPSQRGACGLHLHIVVMLQPQNLYSCSPG